MKKLGIILALAISSSAMAQTYVATWAQKACTCAEALPNSMEGEALQGQMGICMVTALDKKDAESYKKDYGVDILSFPKDSEKFGEALAPKLFEACPSTMMILGKKLTKHVTAAEGRLIKIDVDGFVNLTITEKSGKQSKVLWLGMVYGNDAFASNYKDMVGKDLSFQYEQRELFDPKIGEYRTFKVLTHVK